MEESPARAIFSVGGQEFVLLDTTEDEDSHFLVMSRKSIGKKALTSEGGQLPIELMCWFNNKASLEVHQGGAMGVYDASTDYSVSGGYRTYCESDEEGEFVKLPKEILDNIDENAVWKEEPSNYGVGYNEITYVGGISIPAVTEAERYAGTYGWNDFTEEHIVNDEEQHLWFRTPQSGGGSNDIMLNHYAYWPAATYFSDSTTQQHIRPIFYLKDDFFTNNVFDLDAVGSEVKSAIISNYTYDELINAGYSAEQLDKYYDAGGEITDAYISGDIQTSLPVGVKCTYAGKKDLLVYTLYASDAVDGEYAMVSSQTGAATFTLDPSLGGKYIKVSIENSYGDISYTPVYQVGEEWDRETGVLNSVLGDNDVVDYPYTDGGGNVLKMYQMKRLDTVNITTPSQYLFNVDGMDFIMLDTLKDEDSHFLVMSKNIVATILLAENRGFENTVKYLNSVEPYANNGYIPNADTGYSGNFDMTQLPDSILNAIDYNHVWKIECAMYGTNETTVKGGIVVPAVHEIRQYSEKIGLCDDVDGNGRPCEWWTRTPYGICGNVTNNGELNCYINAPVTGEIQAIFGTAATSGIKPMFYLNRNYFLDNKISLADVGIDVRKTIRSTYSRKELLDAGYSEAELAEYYDVGTNLSQIEIKGINETSLVMTADFTYDGSESSYVLEWYSADSEAGEYKKIADSDGQINYRIPYSLGGKWIKAKVTLIDGTEKVSKAEYINPAWGKEIQVNDEYEAALDENGKYVVTVGEYQIPYDYHKVSPISDTTNPKYTFTYDGREYILLDAMDDDKSKYLVMAKNTVSEEYVSDDGQSISEMLAWLNNLSSIDAYVDGQNVTYETTDYSTDGFLNGFLYDNTIPEAVLGHINLDAEWKTEWKMYSDSYERVYKAGIAIPSKTELIRYSEKIGYHDDDSWWLRTPNAQEGMHGATMLYISKAENNNIAAAIGNGEIKGIRPMFYLDKDFFTSVRVENIGTEAAAIIASTIEKSALENSNLYSEDEINAIYGEAAKYVNVSFKNVEQGKNAEALFTTNCYDGKNVTLIFAVYSSAGRLIAVNYKETTIENVDGVGEETVTIENLAETPDYAKAFLWEGNIGQMKPSSYKINEV